MSNITPVVIFTCPVFETHLFHDPRGHHVENFILAIISINALIASISSCSNGLVIYTISRTPSLQTPSNILILGLASSDFCVGLFVQPTYCVFRFAEFSRNLGLFCFSSKVYLHCCVMLLAISLLTLTAITADRFLAVHLHLRYQELVTVKRYGMVVSFIWVAGIFLTVFSLFTGPTLIVVFIIIFGLLLIANVYFIVKIAQVVHRHSVQIHAQQSTLHSINSRRKTVYTMYCVVGAFLLCYIPYVGVSIIYRVNDLEINRGIHVSTIFAETLFMFNGVLNPIIYCWRIEDMRHEARQLLRKMFRQNENLAAPQNT
jgi:hypothetical protein